MGDCTSHCHLLWAWPLPSLRLSGQCRDLQKYCKRSCTNLDYGNKANKTPGKLSLSATTGRLLSTAALVVVKDRRVLVILVVHWLLLLLLLTS